MGSISQRITATHGRSPWGPAFLRDRDGEELRIVSGPGGRLRRNAGRHGCKSAAARGNTGRSTSPNECLQPFACLQVTLRWRQQSHVCRTRQPPKPRTRTRVSLWRDHTTQGHKAHDGTRARSGRARFARTEMSLTNQTLRTSSDVTASTACTCNQCTERPGVRIPRRTITGATAKLRGRALRTATL